jgi:hypothetical protein
MRYWDEFQPFSGIDAIEARGEIDAENLRACAEEELASLGVGLPVAAPDGLSVTYRPGRPAVSMETVNPATGMTSCAALAAQCSAELNRPFRDAVAPLIRLWVVLTTPQPHIGMTWQHWPIDGVSAADLFRRILARFVGIPLAPEATATKLIGPDLAAIFQPWQTWRHRARFLLETLHENYRFTRIYAPPRPPLENTSLHVHLLDLAHPHRPAGATVNDVVAAAVIWAVADAFPERYRYLWRRRLNLLNFVDLRPFGGEALRHPWGSFLAFFIFNMPEPRPASFDDLIRSFRDQSLWARERETFIASLFGLRTLRAVWPCLPRSWRWSLPRRITPITAGLTNTRYRAEWSGGPLGEHFGRSWRVAPLGCMAPLTADVCTKGDQVSLALTCENRGPMSERIEAIKEKISSLLDTRGRNA